MTMSFDCPYCGSPLDDPGEAFVAHLKQSDACRVPWEHEMETSAEEWSKR